MCIVCRVCVRERVGKTVRQEEKGCVCVCVFVCVCVCVCACMVMEERHRQDMGDSYR